MILGNFPIHYITSHYYDLYIVHLEWFLMVYSTKLGHNLNFSNLSVAWRSFLKAPWQKIKDDWDVIDHNDPILHLEEKEELNSADQGPSQQRATQCALFSTLAPPLPQNLITLCQSHIVSGTADRSSLGCWDQWQLSYILSAVVIRPLLQPWSVVLRVDLVWGSVMVGVAGLLRPLGTAAVVSHPPTPKHTARPYHNKF